MQRGSVNRVLIVGHLGSDPESRYTASGTATTTFRVATNETWRNSEGELQEHTEWHRCVLFGKAAEMAKEYLRKGQLVALEGRLRTRTWEDKDGIQRSTTEIRGDTFTMLGRKPEATEETPKEEETEPAGDDDLPF
ncbi:MAG: single-stranded DNA-binding protein [Fidelibacterota bacterium]